MTRRQPSIALLIAVPLLLAVAAYARVLHGGFVYDDVRVVMRNQGLNDPAALLGTYVAGLLNGGRPTTEITFAVSQAIGGGAPLAFHAGSLVLHLLVVVLVFLFTREVLRLAGRGPSSGAAVAVAGLFALHPLQSQAVSYVSQRSEILASGFYLATLLLLLRADGPGPRWRRVLAAVAALLAFVLGMGAKPIVATAPLAWLLLMVLVPPARPRGERARPGGILLTALVLVGFLLVGGAIRSVTGRQDAGFSVPDATPWSYFLTQLRVVATYVGLLLWPARQSADWYFPWSTRMGDPGVLLAGAFLALLLFAAVLLWWRCRRRDDPASASGRAAAFGVAWFFLVLAPTSSFFPIADVLVEHRVYLASWGIFLAAVLGGDRLIARAVPARRTLVATVLVGAAWVILAVALHRRNAVWEDDLTFWRDVVEKAPGKARPRLGLGTAMLQRGDLQGAADQFVEGVRRVAPEATGLRVSLLQNLGAALIRQGRAKDALVPLQEAVALDPSAIPPAESRALALWLTGDVDEAEVQARGVLARAPDSELCSLVLGQVLMTNGDDGGAIPYLERAVRARPTDPVIRYDLGAAYANLGRKADACAAWRTVLALPAAGGAHEEARQGRAILACPP